PRDDRLISQQTPRFLGAHGCMDRIDCERSAYRRTGRRWPIDEGLVGAYPLLETRDDPWKTVDEPPRRMSPRLRIIDTTSQALCLGGENQIACAAVPTRDDGRRDCRRVLRFRLEPERQRERTREVPKIVTPRAPIVVAEEKDLPVCRRRRLERLLYAGAEVV